MHTMNVIGLDSWKGNSFQDKMAVLTHLLYCGARQSQEGLEFDNLNIPTRTNRYHDSPIPYLTEVLNKTVNNVLLDNVLVIQIPL